MLHFVNRLVVLVFCEFAETPVLIHFTVQKILIDGNQLVVKDFVEMLDNFSVAFHGAVLSKESGDIIT